MARSSKMSVLKRQRERKKAEKAALKRELRGARKEAASEEDRDPSQVATREELADYGIGDADEESAGT